MTMPMKPRVDGYGNPLPDEPVWQGYTLDDLLDHAANGSVTSSVTPGKTGYGLDQVGDANAYEPGAKKAGPDWKGLLGGALAGLSTYNAGERTNFGQGLGSGFVAGTAYGDNRQKEARRNALTDSQIAEQVARTADAQLKVYDYPEDRAMERQKADQQQSYYEGLDAKNRQAIADAIAGNAREDALLPSRIAENQAQAGSASALEWRRRHQPLAGGGVGGANTDAKEYRAFLNQRIRTLQTERGAAQRSYDYDQVEELDAEIERLTAEQDAVARAMPGGEGGAPPPAPRSGAFDGPMNLPPMSPRDTVAPPPPLTQTDAQNPQSGETAQRYADRVGPVLGGAEARRRWQQAHP